ncbi:MAG TPA: DUF308 domain-containing protein [Blastococcus sp.]|nr:DUF308 domain-containing protein [Blastococcus sp.]
MTTDVSRSPSGAPPAKRGGLARIGVGIFGAAAVALGIFLLLNPYDAASTLAWLVGAALLVGGCVDIAMGWGSDGRSTSALPGVLLVIGGLVALFWPGATLWTLAVLVGISLLVHGVARLALAFAGRSEIPGWGWLALAGAINIVVGIMALAWPGATVAVLSLILGCQILFFGLVLLVAAFIGSRSTGWSTAEAAPPTAEAP